MDIPPTNRPNRGVTKRSIALALVLAAINDYWVVQLEAVRTSYPTYAAPFYNCIFTLLVLTVVNMLIKRRWHNIALSRMELLTIYIVISITSGVCSHCMMSILVSAMGYASFFQTPENKWGELIVPRLPKWLFVNDQESLRNFYYGNSSLYDPTNFVPWLVPIFWWSIFTAVLIFTMLCINCILRKQWVEAEKLTFPIIQLPLEMTDESYSLFKSKHMWIGFAFSGTLTLLAGLNYLYPSVPHIRITRVDIGKYITDPPWNAMGYIPMGFYFWAIGLAFLMPLELSFSCWFFYWIGKLELVGSRVIGLHELRVAAGGLDQAYPFLNSQAYGAYLGFLIMSMWASRSYLRSVFRTAFRGTKEIDESNEAISYRTAILGAISGFVFLGIFAYFTGMAAWAIVIFFLLYFVFCIIISRIRSELGFPVPDMNPMGPHYVLTTALGTENIPTQTLVGFSTFSWFNISYASHPAPHQAEAFKLSERTNTAARSIFYAIVIAGIVAMPLGFWQLLHTIFRNGGATANMDIYVLEHGRYVFGPLERWLKQPTPLNNVAMAFVGVGFIVSMCLGWLRMRFLAFPLHPLAYALAPSWGVAQLWMPLLIGSTAKFITLKFGGLKMYRKALPFFFGLILGEITIGSLWTILGIMLGIPTYDFWPGKYR